MIKKIFNYFKFEGDDKDDGQLKKLNFLMYSLIIFVVIYFVMFLYNINEKTIQVSQNQDTLKIVSMLPHVRPQGGYPTNTVDTNFSYVTTNILYKPIKVVVNQEEYTAEKEYSRGDIVLIRYFNVYGIVEDKSILTKDYYHILYRDNNHTLHSIEIPVDFMLKPSVKVITPFMFTQ